MRGRFIFITGVMALGLSACGAQGSDPVGESSSSEVIGSAEAAVTEEGTSETGESMETTASTETVSDTTASTTGPSYEDEDAWLSWEDYGECSNTVKEFYNDDEKKTYYYEMDEFYFSDDKYVSLHFNDTVYYAGAAHPLSYYIPVTISVVTSEEVTPEEILGKTWDEIRIPR